MRVPLLASTALLAFTTAAVAETIEEGTYGMSAPDPAEEIQAPPAPAETEIQATLGTDGPELRELRPDPRYHRGGTYTDAGEETSGGLTQYESEKLALARAAIEASHRAGTLYSTHFPEDAPAPTEDEIDDLKRARLEGSPAPDLSEDPIAGIGAELPALQQVGPEGLTAAELAKRDAGAVQVTEPLARDEETVGAPPTPVSTPDVDESVDGMIQNTDRGGE
jgi:hypothetical protein